MLRLWSWLGWVPFLEYERKRKAAERYAMAFRSATQEIELLRVELALQSVTDEEMGCECCEGEGNASSHSGPLANLCSADGEPLTLEMLDELMRDIDEGESESEAPDAVEELIRNIQDSYQEPGAGGAS